MSPAHRDNDTLPRHQLAQTCGWVILAVVSFTIAQTKGLGLLMVPCSYALLQLSQAASWRQVFHPLLLTGLLFYSPQLRFFWTIFGPGACLLYLILAVWIPLFGLLVHLSSRSQRPVWLLLLSPTLWTGLEYFRSEVYSLRFTWLTLGSAFWTTPTFAHSLGVYGLGFGCMLVAALLQLAIKQRNFASATLGIAALTGFYLLNGPGSHPAQEKPAQNKSLRVAGLQLEFPGEAAVLTGLDRLIKTHPDAQLIMLSEYTFIGPVPASVRGWCREHKRFLVAGGTKPMGDSKYYNMAYVIGPTGNVEFEQAKSRPIQFFKDGLPAEQRRVWHSPWGDIGILICFDLSYTQVTDDLVRQGARLLLVPTMDARGWGAQEHALNARAASLRAAEYGIPVFRLGSSGISQIVDSRGVVAVSSPFPGQGEIIHGSVSMNSIPHLPFDRFLAPLCSIATLLFGVFSIGEATIRRRKLGRYAKGARSSIAANL